MLAQLIQPEKKKGIGNFFVNREQGMNCCLREGEEHGPDDMRTYLILLKIKKKRKLHQKIIPDLISR